MSHTPHPDVHDVGLVDGCPGCAEHAQNPTASLDSVMLADYAERAVDRANGQPSARGTDRSETELLAVTNLLTLLERVGRLAEIAPAQLERYLRTRWHIRCRIEGREA